MYLRERMGMRAFCKPRFLAAEPEERERVCAADMRPGEPHAGAAVSSSMSATHRLWLSVGGALLLVGVALHAIATDGERLCEWCHMHTVPVGPEGDAPLLLASAVGIVLCAFSARHAWRERTWLERVEREAGAPTRF